MPERSHRAPLVADGVLVCFMAALVGWSIADGDALGASLTSLFLGLMLSRSVSDLGRYMRGR